MRKVSTCFTHYFTTFYLCFFSDIDMANCPYGRVATGAIFDNTDSFAFPEILSGNIPNPMLVKVREWEVSQ